jgi:hypothetical protein
LRGIVFNGISFFFGIDVMVSAALAIGVSFAVPVFVYICRRKTLPEVVRKLSEV